jgi:hypothetical protein
VCYNKKDVTELNKTALKKSAAVKKPTESARLVRAHGEYAVGITLEPSQKGSICFLIARLPALRALSAPIVRRT